jgi:hypothetical protein
MKYLTILFLFATTISINAQDIVVNGSGLPGTYSTISAAVQAANSGDKILVSNQAFPYQEDTLFIDKDITILPYSDITHIEFEGDIQITLDSISDLTLIGFDSPGTDIFTVFNDTTRNSLSTVNIVDCHFYYIFLDQPKTSLYLSYSTASRVYFSHGDIIGNTITQKLILGIHDYSSYGSINGTLENTYKNQLGSTYNMSACDLFENNVRFGNVETYSDTCNIIANSLYHVVMNTKDFAFNIKNNSCSQDYQDPIMVFLCCPTATGVNQIINNALFLNGHNSYNNYNVKMNLAYCSTGSIYNFSDVTVNILNNDGKYILQIDRPESNYSEYNLSNLTTSNNKGVVAYNDYNSIYSEITHLDTVMFKVGPTNSNNTNPNPSPAHLNLDLTPNTLGKEGGSDAWSNYHPNGNVGFGTMTGSKARITYLNLPTQIFDPNNIQIKAKAVHGN